MKILPQGLLILSKFVGLGFFFVFRLSAQPPPACEWLGSALNSEYAEYAPVIAPDGQVLYFVRDGHPDNVGLQKGQNIWASARQPDGQWGPAYHAGSQLNDDRHSALLSISADGKQALVMGFFREGKRVGSGFSRVYRQKEGWSRPEGLHIKDLEQLNQGHYSSACLDRSGQVLLLSFAKEVKGDYDLHVSFQDSTGQWSRPLSLGPRLNTAYSEATPFLAADNRTLFFASLRPGGFGNYDIYVSRRLGNAWQDWTPPQNLGPPFNDAQSNIYFSLPVSGEMAYLSSVNPQSSNYDLYRVALPPEFRPAPVARVQGRVYDARSGQIIKARFEVLSLSDTLSPGQSVASETPYQLILSSEEVYTLRIEAEGYLPLEVSLDLPQGGAFQEIQKDFYMQPSAIASEDLPENCLFFEYGQSDILPRHTVLLEQWASYLRQRPGLGLDIQGFTDDIGPLAANLRLSQRRAEACYQYLRQKGIPAPQLRRKGLGPDQSFKANRTEEARKRSRRVALQVFALPASD
ncbi:MAG: hypothetical protein OHK0053_22310 [Microscillaceae bacterium]